jgi:hypothetical protein
VSEGYGSEPSEPGQIARALVSKGWALDRNGRSQEAIAAYDEVVERFGGASEADVREE